MLYSVPIILNDKEYQIKIGTRQLIQLQRNKLDLASNDLEVMFKIVHMCIKDNDMTLDQLIDAYDESDINLDDLRDILDQAIELGINKGKPEKKTQIIQEIQEAIL